MDSRPLPPNQSYSPPPSSSDMRYASPTAHSRQVPPSPSETSSGYYPPPPAHKQQPIQIPFAPADPFRISRPPDPFLPNPSPHQRRESSNYGYGGGRDVASGARDGSQTASWQAATSASSTGPPLSTMAPAPPVTSSSSPYGYDPARSHSGGAHSPPRYYGSGPENLSGPNTFGGRHMPPPSPSQQASGPAYSSRPTLPPLSGRELPTPGSSHRSGADMSISSILGTDMPSQSSYPQPTSANQSPSSSMRPPSPRRMAGGGRNEPQHWRRPDTPEKHHGHGRIPDAPNYGSSSSPRYSSATTARDPTDYRQGPQYPSHPTPPRSTYQTQTSPVENYPRPDDRYPPRPTSQPSAYEQTNLPPRQPYAVGIERTASQDGPRFPFSSVQPVSTSFSSSISRTADDNLLRRNLLGQEPIREDSRRDFVQNRKDDYQSPGRTGYRGQYYGHQSSISPAEAPRSHPLPNEPIRREAYGNPDPYQRPVYDERRPPEPIVIDSRPQYDMTRPTGGEEMQKSRSFLGISSDISKRGRASPLPQAVKGAQPQMTKVGPGSDPSIKSEFGRIFQGLGSGLGGPGNLTPSRQSPAPQRVRDDMGNMSDNDGKMSRVGSRGPRLGRRQRDDEDDGRITPLSFGIDKSKRARLSHGPGHRLVDEDVGSFRSLTPSRYIAPQLPPAVKPILRISSGPVLSAVEGKDRHDLGSALYDVVYKPSPFAGEEGKHRSFMQFKPSRRFTEDHINNIFTIRVDRSYLTHEMRQRLCTERYIYGTEIFTDDSDPILAAIHSGWIRGAWGPDVPVELMDLPAEPSTNLPLELEIRTPPSLPVIPPPNMEAHLTLLLLPPLQEYGSSLRFGVKSRSWGHNHDGISFMIIGLRWIDEGAGRGMDNTAQGKKKRIKALLDAREQLLGPHEHENGVNGVNGTKFANGKRAQNGHRANAS